MFAAGVGSGDGGLVATGGRVLTIVGRGADCEAAADLAYRAADLIGLPGAQIRRDIGRAPVLTHGSRPMIPRYTLPEMGELWSDQRRFDAMLEVELAVLRVLADRGVVPADAVATIEDRARVDPTRTADLERTTDHDVIAFVSQVAETVGDEGRWLHYGLTSSDVVDTALALQCRAAGDLLAAAMADLIDLLASRAGSTPGP